MTRYVFLCCVGGPAGAKPFSLHLHQILNITVPVVTEADLSRRKSPR